MTEKDKDVRIASLEAELEKANEACLGAIKNFVRVREKLDEVQPLWREAESESSRLLRECEGLRETINVDVKLAKVAVRMIEQMGCTCPEDNREVTICLKHEALKMLACVLSRQEPAPKPEAATKPCDKGCSTCEQGRHADCVDAFCPCSKKPLPTIKTEQATFYTPIRPAPERLDNNIAWDTKMAAPDGKELSAVLVEAMSPVAEVDAEMKLNGQNGNAFSSWAHIAVRHVAVQFYGRARVLAAEVRRLHKMNQESHG